MPDTILLFDIDGTILVPAPGRGYRREIKAALTKVYGTAGRIDEVRFAGKTDLSILREALEPEGVMPEVIRERLGEWEASFIELTTRLDREAPLFVACAGVCELLATLDRDERYALSILTGNLEPMAAIKLAAVGLGGHFRLRGAYGSDHEDRNALPAIASARIAAQIGREYAPEQFVIVGDTPRDVEAARAFGMRCVAVATGHFSVDALAAHGPDVVLQDLSDLDRVLALLAG
jgi:phosphoglycolate phosphatase-like HAD superfamily hydrolase